MRLAAPLAIVLLLAAFVAGCGSSDNGGGSNGGGAGGGASKPAPPANGSGAPAGASSRSCPLAANRAEGLRATGISCGAAQRLALAWQGQPKCAPKPGASRSSCSVRSYRCLTALTDRGLAVSCAQPGRSLAFTAKP
jgi:hypothetical protein